MIKVIGNKPRQSRTGNTIMSFGVKVEMQELPVGTPPEATGRTRALPGRFSARFGMRVHMFYVQKRLGAKNF